MTENPRTNLSGKDEALLILEYLENEQMSKTFLNFLDENKHLKDLRARLYANYAQPEPGQQENDLEVNEFQAFFNLSLNLSKQTESIESTFLSSPFDLHSSTNPHTNDILFDEDFLNVGLHDLISQTPPMDYPHELPDTPIPSVPTQTSENEDFQSTIEQLFAIPHQPAMPTTTTSISPPVVQVIADSTSKTSFTKCIVVTQDFLQSMYRQDQYQQASGTIHSTHLSSIHRPKRRRRRLKVGKENSYQQQQRKIMPRTTFSPEH